MNRPAPADQPLSTTPPSAAEIRLEGLTVTYGTVEAVKSLDLTIAAGEMLVLLGPSGCGKTSTMRAIAGLEVPTAGMIRIGDTTVFDSANGVNIPPNRRGIGMVFQSYAIWPHKSVYDNVAFPLRMKKTPKEQIRPKVEHALARVGLEGFANRGASRLSGGQMQRVAFARALATESSTLLFDEPLSNLDAKLRDRLRFELREIQQEVAFTSIYVTHDQTEAMVLADRVAVMREGRIVQLDGPEEIYRRPHDSFVADFFGHINIFPARVEYRPGTHPVARLTDWPLSITSALDGPTEGVTAVCLRPDALTISPTASADAENVLTGVVSRTTGLGTHVRYQVAITDGPEVEVLATGAAVVRSGEKAFLSIKASDVRLLVG